MRRNIRTVGSAAVAAVGGSLIGASIAADSDSDDLYRSGIALLLIGLTGVAVFAIRHWMLEQRAHEQRLFELGWRLRDAEAGHTREMPGASPVLHLADRKRTRSSVAPPRAQNQDTYN